MRGTVADDPGKPPKPTRAYIPPDSATSQQPIKTEVSESLEAAASPRVLHTKSKQKAASKFEIKEVAAETPLQESAETPLQAGLRMMHDAAAQGRLTQSEAAPSQVETAKTDTLPVPNPPNQISREKIALPVNAGDNNPDEICLPSDSEDEHEQCQQAVRCIETFVEMLKRKPGDLCAALPGGKPQNKEKGLLVLLRAKRLLQEDPDIDELEDGGEPIRQRARVEVEAKSHPTYPQARAFMQEMGFADWSEAKDKKTLVTLCCEQSRTRTS